MRTAPLRFNLVHKLYYLPTNIHALAPTGLVNIIVALSKAYPQRDFLAARQSQQKN